MNRLRDECHKIAKEHGFWDEPRNQGELIALMHSELSEALECLRSDDVEEPIETEFADVIIRIMDYCGYYNLNIGQAIQQKLGKNRGRPYKHGKKF